MRILVGITGGIAAFKAAEIVREFTELGHDVRVVPTPNALRFIGAATLEALSHNPVSSELYSDVADVRHIELAQWAEAILIAPATASFLARTAAGVADDLLGNVILATAAPILIAPAMHSEMWTNMATSSNVALLRSRGLRVIEPGVGRLTGGDSGVGRLPEADQLVRETLAIAVPKDLAGKKVLVIAGGTREFIDPVRYIGNRSSGKQGIALVEEATARGATVTLIAANFSYDSSEVVVESVQTTADLLNTLEKTGFNFDVIVMPAAVSDFKPEIVSDSKIKKSGLSTLDLHLIENPDVISMIASSARAVNAGSVIVGFAAETASGDKLGELGQEKMTRKGLDLIVANDVSNGGAFDVDDNAVSIIGLKKVLNFSGSKAEIAKTIFDSINKLDSLS
jgi:phosphopantothenoylcysteine decarboxylase/phosphopantothenate--cysteine ligase